MKIMFLLLVLLSVITGTSAQSVKKIVILHTNDLHSRLYGFWPEASYSPDVTGNDSTRGGFSRIAAILKNEREKNPGITLTIDGGDFLMGTLFHALEERTGFQLRLMNLMGYDVVVTGNHEYDFGPERLARIIKTSDDMGEIPPVLAGNAVFTDKDTGDDQLEKLLTDGLIKRSIVLERDGLRIGVFSVMGKDAEDVAPLSRPVKFSRQKSFARKMVRELKNEKCEIIICVSHSGITRDKNGQWEGEDVRLARKVKGIDLIISGHTHSTLPEPLVVRDIPIVQTGEYGKNIGRLSMIYRDGKLFVEGYSLIPVDDNVQGDPEIERIIGEQRDLIDSLLLSPLNISYQKPVAESDFLLECNEYGDFMNSNLGPMIADAIHAYINKHSENGTDVSMVAVGVIRDRIIPGILTSPDVFRIMSLGSGSDNIPGYPLSRIYVTGRELKSVLEILQVAYKSSPSNFCFYSGLRVRLDPEKGLLRKILKIEIEEPSGATTEVDFSKENKTLYSISANSYMLEFIGIIKKMSFGLINVVPKDSEGEPITDMKDAVIDMNSSVDGIQEGKEWLALMEFIGSMEDTDGDGIPDISRKYSVPVSVFSSEE
jgi:5'-nucleotidase